jgi:hypothetical protein
MNSESRFLKLCREVEELKLTFLLLPHRELASKPKHSIADASEAEDLLLDSIKSITHSRIFAQKIYQICTTEDVIQNTMG